MRVPALLLILPCLLPCASAGWAAPRIADLRFEGPEAVDRAVLRAAAAHRLGDPAETSTLLDILARLTGAGPVGCVDLELEPMPGAPDEVMLRVRFDGHRRYVERVDITRVGAPVEREISQLRRRRAIAEGAPLQLEEGGRYHPFLLELDRRSLEALERRRGHLDAKVTALAPTSEDLATVIFEVDPGPAFRYGRRSLSGVPAGVTPAPPHMERGDLAVDTDIEAERERLRVAVCEAGYPDARVTVRRTSTPAGELDLAFVVGAGPRLRVGAVHLTGDPVPPELLGQTTGAPFCGHTLDARLDALRAHLRGLGHLGAQVTATVQRHQGRADLTVRVNRGGVAHLRRVWFRGQIVTRERILRQLIAVREGQVVRPALIRESVEDLRRSELFLQVSSRLVESAERGAYYLIFQIEERDLATIDFDARTLTLHNMNLAVPDSAERAADGVTLRGGGQVLRLRGADDWYGFGLRDPFLWRAVVATLDADLRFHDFGALQETTLRVVSGVGWRTWRNQLSLEGLWYLLYASPTATEAAFEAAPVQRQPSVSTGPGLRFRLDLNRLDAERIAFLGIDLTAELSTSLSPFPGAPWTSWSTRVGVNLPLFENRRAQHWAVHLGLRGDWVKAAPVNDLGGSARGPVFGFQRRTPTIRGYASSAIREDYPVGERGAVRLGGEAAFEGTVELRVPLRSRRTALLPFVDFASVGARDAAPWADAVLSAGGQLEFSLFDERLEGVVFVAFPFDSALASDLVGVGARGSFE